MCIKTVKKKKGKGIALFYFNFLKITTWYKIRVTLGDSRVAEEEETCRTGSFDSVWAYSPWLEQNYDKGSSVG